MAADEDYPNVGLGDEEEDDEEGMLEAEDPIMDRIQFALKKQLKGAYDVAALKVSEQTEELTRKKRQREDIGVSLYAVQQQLAKLQMNLEKVHDNHAIIAQMRETAEEDLAKVRASYEVKYRDAKEHRAKAESAGRSAGHPFRVAGGEASRDQVGRGDAQEEHRRATAGSLPAKRVNYYYYYY